MLQFEDSGNFDLSTLRKMHSGGGASHREMVKGIMDRFGICYYNGERASYSVKKITDASGQEQGLDAPMKIVETHTKDDGELKGFMTISAILSGYSYRIPETGEEINEEQA